MGVRARVGLSIGVGLGVGTGVGSSVGTSVAAGVAFGVASGLGVAVGVGGASGVNSGVGVGALVGSSVGVRLGVGAWIADASGTLTPASSDGSGAGTSDSPWQPSAARKNTAITAFAMFPASFMDLLPDNGLLHDIDRHNVKMIRVNHASSGIFSPPRTPGPSRHLPTPTASETATATPTVAITSPPNFNSSRVFHLGNAWHPSGRIEPPSREKRASISAKRTSMRASSFARSAFVARCS